MLLFFPYLVMATRNATKNSLVSSVLLISVFGVMLDKGR